VNLVVGGGLFCAAVAVAGHGRFVLAALLLLAATAELFSGKTRA
jgi:hypothetical protein